MPHLPLLSPTNVGFLVLCLWATGFSGPLCVLTGRYYMKTGRLVSGHVRAYPLHPFPPRLLPRSDFPVTVQTGPAVRRHGRNILIFGILNLIGFVVSVLCFTVTVTDPTVWGVVVLGLIVELPLAVYFGTAD